MEKRCALGFFCFALFIANKPTFAAQIEAITEKDKPLTRKSSSSRPAQRYPWKTNIVTTIFWIGEQPGGHNLTPNRTSSWDKQWTKSYVSEELYPGKIYTAAEPVLLRTSLQRQSTRWPPPRSASRCAVV